MRNLARSYLALCAAGFLFIGFSTFHDPVAALAGIELRPTSISALNEVRANYGGLQITIGMMMLAGALMQRWRRPALWIGVAVTGGLVAGRLVSIAIDGLPNHVVISLLVLETTCALIGATLLCWKPRNHPEC